MGTKRQEASRKRRTVTAAAATAALTAATILFGGQGGVWATRQMAAYSKRTGTLAAAALRTADTLRHEEWKFFDDAIIEEAKLRLVGVADLVSAGFVKTVPNALGKMVFGYEKANDLGDAEISLDGMSTTGQDKVEFQLNQIALPIFHKDFFINLRVLTASRDKGEALDTMQARMAARVVAEQMENVLFNGGPQFGSMPMYGYRTHPDRNTVTSFNSTKNWEDNTKTGASYLADTQTMIAAAVADRQHGPYTLYVSSAADILLDNDYNAGTANTQTIRQRLLSLNKISAIRAADMLPSGSVILKQNSIDVACWVAGENLQTVQWDEAAGFRINFKAFAIGAPLIRSDISGRSGIVHLAVP